MSDSESITVADVSAGPGGGDAESGTPVDLPVVELLTGRGLITGKSGSGKSNSASVLIEELLAKGFPVLVVDTDGEYYGLKEEFELLHAGADDECDIRVTPEHAGKLAELALEGNVPIILDVSGYLDEDVASELVCETARHLFAKEKKMKKPFLMLVEECHEYVPEGGGLDETGRMLVKVGKRGRKHGLGIVGISQRPANVKKDFITQCDWLVWHRLTWDNDTKVVRRIIDREHADAVEDLDDGEAFLMTDWSESVRRVQFRRKRTFDAGATPGLDDVERPELKSVSDDLVGELQEISAERERRESELADLRTELEEREARIRELERELEQARDLEQMADRFSQALLRRAGAPHRAPDGDGQGAPAADPTPDEGAEGDQTAADERRDSLDQRPPLADAAPWPDPLADGDDDPDTSADTASDGREMADAERDDARDAGGRAAESAHGGDATPDPPSAADGEADAEGADGTAVVFPDEDDSAAGDPADGRPGPDAGPAPDASAEAGADAGVSGRANADADAEANAEADAEADADEETDAGTTGLDPSTPVGTRERTRESLVEDLIERIAALDDVSRGMLRYYRAEGPAEPVAAHLDAGGDADREVAYSRNRTLRTAGLVAHAGRGAYDYALPALVREEGGDRLRDPDLRDAVRSIESSFVSREGPDDDETGSESDPEDTPVETTETDDVEVVEGGNGDGAAAFREDDAEFVETTTGGDGRPGAPGRDAGDEASDDEAVVMQETGRPSDGMVDRSEEPRDAEFVE